jgi:hypothetical protein
MGRAIPPLSHQLQRAVHQRDEAGFVGGSLLHGLFLRLQARRLGRRLIHVWPKDAWQARARLSLELRIRAKFHRGLRLQGRKRLSPAQQASQNFRSLVADRQVNRRGPASYLFQNRIGYRDRYEIVPVPWSGLTIHKVSQIGRHFGSSAAFARR